MDECATFAVWWKLTSRGIFETFDDGRLSRPVVSDDEGQWRVELDRFATDIIERANSNV